MPIYEYQCDGCGEVFEVRQRLSDPAPAAHACGSTALHRVLSATSFVLKGTGWYATDYGNRSAPPKEGGEGGGGGEGSKNEAKPAKDASTSKDGAATAKADGAKTTPGAGEGASKAGAGADKPAKAAAAAAKPRGGGGPAAA